MLNLVQIDGVIVDEAVTKDAWFDEFRAPHTDAARELVAEVICQIEEYEKKKRLRMRKRKDTPKAPDKTTFETTVAAIVSDLCYHYSRDPERRVSVSRSHQLVGSKSRYASEIASTKVRITLLDYMASPELALVVQRIGEKYQDRRTTIQAGPQLIALIEKHGVDDQDFKKTGYKELIVLREKRGENWFTDKSKELPYEDTPETHRYRAEMVRINDWIEAADLSFDAASCVTRVPVDIRNRNLRRSFTATFTQVGRLNGGFWQGMNKEERRGIRIDGQPIACLDYSQSCPRILYGLAGATPPREDIYDIPKLRGHRDGTKLLLLSLMCSDQERTKRPKGSRKLLPKSPKATELFQWVAEAHPALRPFFWTGIGLNLMFRESVILVDVLLTLIDMGIVALPIHDAVVVRHDTKEQVKEVMLVKFREHARVDGVVKEE
ncbi:hypothetical protein SAMN04488503_0185 [Humidesulfovibrio mexicanus]|uniref:Uncharacterized protein n=1 Tax=Humidesulfovibrio mexicanus TaxID=147047 RepID=A0A239DCZ7_9BACT|nr:hypothetical protein [Humidesulfovibrio mexicanus]SNS29543.1 hypothetical protein SAMN04488503_0185 [Humidesulfovibrio mexicanus]